MKLRAREAGLEIFLEGRSGEGEITWELSILSLKTY